MRRISHERNERVPTAGSDVGEGVTEGRRAVELSSNDSQHAGNKHKGIGTRFGADRARNEDDISIVLICALYTASSTRRCRHLGRVLLFAENMHSLHVNTAFYQNCREQETLLYTIQHELPTVSLSPWRRTSSREAGSKMRRTFLPTPFFGLGLPPTPRFDRVVFIMNLRLLLRSPAALTPPVRRLILLVVLLRTKAPSAMKHVPAGARTKPGCR